MKSKIHKGKSAFILLTSVLFVLLGMIFCFSSGANESAKADASADMTVIRYQGSKFDNNAYKKAYKVSASEIESYAANGGERGDYALSNAFDTAANTYWISQEENTETFKNHVMVQFAQAFRLDGFSFAGAYFTASNGVRNFSGYPTLLHVYAANGNDNYELVGTCESTPVKNFSEQVVFSFSSFVKCDRLKIEFAEVSVYSQAYEGKAVVVALDISFYKADGMVTRTSAQLDADRIAIYKVPASVMSVQSNCDAASSALSHAFDDNWGTCWYAAKDNVNGHYSAITVNFARPIAIDRIVYQCSGANTGFGYPTRLGIYTDEDGTSSFYGECVSAATSDQVIFAFREAVTVTQIVFRWNEVYTAHKYQATAREIWFLQPENENANALLDLFADYTQHTVRADYNSESKLNELREGVKDMVSYESTITPLIERAEACVRGYITKDVHREFQTDPAARNPINRYGNMTIYARKELRLNSIGTNRQVIGIGGATGEEIIVYVDAEPNDPLPSLVFTQIYGAWNSWSSSVSLKRGKNVFRFPNFKGGGSYTVPVNAGGPIHVVNPYTPSEQSSNVKLYFEGGYIYPVFHDDDDETTFKMMLDDYYRRLKDPNNNSITIDAFEAVSDSIILSCTASRAYAGYITKGQSPQQNIDRWNDYVHRLLSFGGVDCVEGGTYYNEKNKHITINYRAVQPYAGMYAFAATEHIGIPDAGTHAAMVLKGNPGWAFAHEFGHTVDLQGRIWGEVTNNMWAMYDRFMIEGNYDDKIGLGQVSGKIASDLSSNVGKLWNYGNCAIWYIIEGAHPGYWAGSENAYRYETTQHPENAAHIGRLTKTEQMIYFGSLGAKDDLREYFERWGFYMNGDGTFGSGNRWARSKQSSDLNALMQKAIDEGRIEQTAKKYWYIDVNQYRYLRQHGEKLGAWASCYDDSDSVNISSVMRVGNATTLLLPTPADATAHLGYEIQSKIDGVWKVIGFTYNSAFTDTTDYGGETPVYRVVAYDRMLCHSGVSQEKSPSSDTATEVCRIIRSDQSIYFDTLKDAVADARNGEIIRLRKSCYAGGIGITHKKVIICPDDGITGDLVITKSASGHMFSLSADAYVWDTSLQIGNTTGNGARIVLDGNDFYQSGALVRSVWSNVSLNNVLLRNNNNSGNGGAVYAGLETTLALKAVTIENNRAANGGGIYMEGRTRVKLNGVTIRNNTASGSGGGVYSTDAYGGADFNNSDARNSENFITGNTAQYGGGIFAQNKVNLFRAEISENTASVRGGGIYADVPYGRGNIGMTTCKMRGNVSPAGSTYYINRGRVYLNGGAYDGGFYKGQGGSDKPELYLNGAMPDLGGAEFVLPVIAKDGTILVDGITNMTVTEAQVNTIVVRNGRAVLLEDNKVAAHSNLVTVEIRYDGESFDYACPMGKFTVPECIPEWSETMYFVDWQIDGHRYAAGEAIELTQSVIAQATVRKYCKVTIVYDAETDEKEIQYFKPNDAYYVPMNTPSGKSVLRFTDSDGNDYVYADRAVITSDVTFTAVTKQMVNLICIVGEESSVTAYEYGRTVILPTPTSPAGQYFRYWLIDGEEYESNYGVRLTSDLIATAMFSEYCRVTVSVGDRDTVYEMRPNTLYTLAAAEAPEGQYFSHWIIDEVVYYAGADYLIGKDATVVAVFCDLPQEKTMVTVTLEYAKDGEPFRQKLPSMEIDSLYTLPDLPEEEGKIFLYWTIHTIKYDVGTVIRVTQDITAVAEIVNADTLQDVLLDFVVTNVADDGASKISRYRFTAKVGDRIALAAPTHTPDGYVFQYYSVDGERKEIGEEVELSLKTDIKAVYASAAAPRKAKKSGASKVVVAVVSTTVGAAALGGIGVGVFFIVKKRRAI